MGENHVKFVYWNKIYTISENAGVISICKGNGYLLIQTTPQKLAEETSPFFKMANMIYTYCKVSQ